MDPDFGVGLRNFLFENNVTSTYSEIESRVKSQIKFYMPFIEVVGIEFNPFTGRESSGSGLHINIRFHIVPFDLFASLEIEVGTN